MADTEGIDAVRELVRERMRELGLTAIGISQKMHRNDAYVADYLNRGTPAELPEQSRLALSKILGVPEERLRGPKTREVKGDPALPVPMPRLAPKAGNEGVQLSLDQAREGARYEAAKLDRAEIWRISTDAIAGLGFTPGDCVVVDLGRTPRVSDPVMAMHRNGTEGVIFRIYQPPYLLSFRIADAPLEPLLVDHSRTVIRGVLVYRCWVADQS